MGIVYFKTRGRFDFSKNSLDIGNPISWSKPNLLKFLFKKVFAIDSEKLKVFYQYHLDFFLESNPEESEEAFFKNLWDIIAGQLKVLQGKDVYDKNHVRIQKERQQLEKFTELLILKDQWNCHESKDAIIVRQEAEIYALQIKIEDLKIEVREARKLETNDHIRITKGNLLTFVDLCLQLQELKLDDRTELLFSQTQAVWMKMICKNFTDGNDPIALDTLKRYFSADKKAPGIKHAPVPEESKIFMINRTKKRT